MVEIILNLAEIYKLQIVAEGVETREQFEYLKSIGCHQAQGYLFSKPLSSSELVTLLEKNK
jgi:EAL domain-containing protein (putative c-di-GMP-specific phosphodiesterase class I)